MLAWPAVLETLTRGFSEARDRLKGTTRLSEENVAEALRTVRLSLLEADVDLGTVRQFLQAVSDRALGRDVALRGGKRNRRTQVSPGDHFTKACYEELVALMGPGAPLPAVEGTRVLMLLGLQGCGKTSTAAKLAHALKRAGERPLLVAADVRRPAAREQLATLAEQIGVDVHAREGDDAAAICAEAVARAREENYSSVLLDTAGRLQIDDELMLELEQIAAGTQPDQSLLVCDAMMGREALNVAKGFSARLPLDGLILTKLDGDARGGAALAIRHATGIPVCFVTTGEAIDRLEPFRPEGLASRILGMGDVVGLMQDFEEVIDTDKAEEEAARMLKGKFTLGDFLSQLRMLQRAGPIQDLIEKLPFAGDLLPAGANVDARELTRIQAMITSMTPEERRRPEILDASRKARIAHGSGTRIEDLTQMLKRFGTMRQVMSQLGGGGGALARVPGLGRMLGGGLPGLDPASVAQMGLGAGGARRAARAQKADARRKQRRAKRRHKRRGKRR